MKDLIVVKYGEISLKGLNRPVFEAQLIRNLRFALRDTHAVVNREHGRLFVEAERAEAVLPLVARTFGVVGASPAKAVPLELPAICTASRAVLAAALLTTLAYLQWVERKVIAHIQLRLGPSRVGPFGLFQPLADVIKLLTKEDLIPPQARVVVRPGPAWQRLALDDHLTEHASVSYFGGSWAGHDSSTDRARILAADVGVTGATALVMETATALLAADDAWGQLVSGLPFTHVVVAPAFKLVDTLPEGLALVRRYSELALSKPLARYVAGISGPSRTGDIEMIIVQGMHGPGRVHLLLLDVEPGAEMLGGYPAELLLA